MTKYPPPEKFVGGYLTSPIGDTTTTTNCDPYAEPFATYEIDACVAEINALEVSDLEAPWYLDSGAMHHVSEI